MITFRIPESSSISRSGAHVIRIAFRRPKRDGELRQDELPKQGCRDSPGPARLPPIACLLVPVVEKQVTRRNGALHKSCTKKKRPGSLDRI
jgi:hypothetical protein